MQECPWCGTPFDGAAPFCTNCGKERIVEEPQRGSEQQSAPETAPPKPPQVVAKANRQRPAFSRLTVFSAAAVVLGVTLFALSRLDPQTPDQPFAAAAVNTSAPAPATASSPIEDSPTAPTWVGRRQATWANDGSKTISFELQAINDVPVWMTRTRPVLVVRCLYRRTEVFVSPGSAASFEAHTDTHTVRLRIDDDQEVVQQWSDSVTNQELFAPDGIALARRLARARHLQFGFTPYNAKPVTVQFRVVGFDQLVGLVAKTCAWRVDDPGTPTTRPVGLR